MRRSLYALVLVLTALIASGCAKTANKTADKPGKWNMETSAWSATVVSIDHNTRIAKIKGPEGNIISFRVSDDVQNLDKVRSGDIVDVDVMEAYAIYVRKSSEAPYEQENIETEYGTEAGLPTKTVVASMEVTALVTAADYGKRTLTLKNPDGETVLVKVPEAVKRFKNIKVGDEIVTRYTQNTIYSVRKP